MPEPEIYFPDLEKIERLKVDSFFLARENELAKKVQEYVIVNKKTLGWLVYGWLLSSVKEVEKIKPYVDDIPILHTFLKYYLIIMKWQAKRLGQNK
jgi:hypothetical protein